MATIRHTHQEIREIKRAPAQRISFAMGIIFLVLGITGIVVPGTFGLYPNLTYSVLHLATGTFGIWLGTEDEAYKSSLYCISLGLIFLGLGFAGFVFGSPAPADLVHNVSEDRYFFELIPQYFGLGTPDHIFHIIVACIFLFGASPIKQQIVTRVDKTYEK